LFCKFTSLFAEYLVQEQYLDTNKNYHPCSAKSQSSCVENAV